MALHYRTCPFCEATCGLEIETERRPVLKNDHFDARELVVPEGQMG